MAVTEEAVTLTRRLLTRGRGSAIVLAGRRVSLRRARSVIAASALLGGVIDTKFKLVLTRVGVMVLRIGVSFCVVSRSFTTHIFLTATGVIPSLADLLTVVVCARVTPRLILAGGGLCDGSAVAGT